MRTILALLTAIWLPLVAVEVPATVVSVADGDTMTVKLADQTEAKIRFVCIDTAESHNNSHGAEMPEGVKAATFLRALLPVGVEVKLWGPKERLEKDRYERLLAFVVMADQVTAQEKIVAAGWSVYWRKYGEATEPYHTRLLKAQDAAKAASAGAWATAEKWMVDKSNERTAPKAK